MAPPAAAVASAILLALSAHAGFSSTSCPGVAGDGKTDDGPALQECLGSKSGADRAVQLTRGATYVISDTLYLTRRRQLTGGSNAQGVLTTIRCNTLQGWWSIVADSGEFEFHGIHFDHCSIRSIAGGNLTLVDSVISNIHEGLRAGTSSTFNFPSMLYMQRSKILDCNMGMSIHDQCWMVMQDSEVNCRVAGVVVTLFTPRKVPELELRSSTIRDCHDSAIVVQVYSVGRRRGEEYPMQARVLLAEKSSLQNSTGPCILVKSGGALSQVSLTGGSWLRGCAAGIMLKEGRSHAVVLKGGSWIRGCRSAIVLEAGAQHEVVVEGSSLQRSSVDGVVVRQGEGHSVTLSGHALIEHSGGSGIHVEGGHGHAVVITGDTSLRNSSGHGIVLAAGNTSLRLKNSAIWSSRGSAVHVRPPEFSADTTCEMVSLQDAYLVRNGQGFWCRRTCAVGEIGGVVYLNGVDFDNGCSGDLSRPQGPLSGVMRLQALKTTIKWWGLCVVVGMASVPWLQVLRTCCHAHNGPLGRLPLLALLGALALLTPIFQVWAKRMMDLWHVLQHLRQEDIEEEGVKPLFILAVACPLFVTFGSLIVSRWWLLRRWQAAQVLDLMRALEDSLWRGDTEAEQHIRVRLEGVGLPAVKVLEKVQELRRQQSQEAGVSVAYLISSEFLELARSRTGLENPTFLNMKDPFWRGEAAIGKEVMCPRDGRPGCALVDTLHPRDRQRCTHFLSWVWRYPILLVREALQIWTQQEGLDPSRTFLFMCFFVNNQFRILIEGSQGGSDDLETTFEQNLRRIGRVVALLDHWDEPLYLSRVWTIYEQFMAAKLQLPVTVILNQKAGESLVDELDKGKDGIFRITDTLCNVRSEMAEASVKADEEHVKATIRSTIGFDCVNKRVRCCMIDWVASVVRRHMDYLVNHARTGANAPGRRGLVQRISCTQLQGTERAVPALELEASGAAQFG